MPILSEWSIHKVFYIPTFAKAIPKSDRLTPGGLAKEGVDHRQVAVRSNRALLFGNRHDLTEKATRPGVAGRIAVGVAGRAEPQGRLLVVAGGWQAVWDSAAELVALAVDDLEVAVALADPRVAHLLDHRGDGVIEKEVIGIEEDHDIAGTAFVASVEGGTLPAVLFQDGDNAVTV